MSERNLHAPSETVAVVIGRNEGERLRRCLQSLRGQTVLTVYVDSGSTDDSFAMAQSLGAVVVRLDTTVPFTAARARNAGFACARRELAGMGATADVRHVQFVDGDCEIIDGWVQAATDFLDSNPRAAAACGRRRERFPQASIYNLVCDFEWNTPVGQARAFGGDVLIRIAALEQAGGYRDDLIAGEEPELAVRLRQAGWTLWRLDRDMTWHDAAITRYSQWWKRSTRAGYAFAEGARLHGGKPERHWVLESRRAVVWGAALPLAMAAMAAVAGPWWLLGFLVYPVQVLRQYVRLEGSVRTRLGRAVLLVVGKFAEATGAGMYLAHRLRGGSARLIEYK